MKKLLLVLSLAVATGLTAVTGCGTTSNSSSSSGQSVQTSQNGTESLISSTSEMGGGVNSQTSTSTEVESSASSCSSVVSTSENVSSSEEISTSQSESVSQSVSESVQTSTSENVSSSEEISVSQSESVSQSVSESVQTSTSENVSSSEEISTSQSESVSQSVSESEQTSTSENFTSNSQTGTTTSSSTSNSESIVNECTVTWKNADGTVLDTDTVAYGTIPTYSGETPTKNSTAQYTYTFSGWSPSITAVTEDVTYTAQFSSTVNTYTVTLKNNNGTSDTVLQNVPYGTQASVIYGENYIPTKEGHTFDGWYLGSYKVQQTDTVTSDMELSAIFTVNSYTITWNIDGTTSTASVEYGVVPTYDGTPIKNASGTTVYVFAGWSTEADGTVLDTIPTVVGEEEYFAIFDTVELDGTRNEIYGTYTETVNLANGEYYNVSAKKLANGVLIHTQALFSSTVINTDSADWWVTTNFEFKLNGGEQSFINFEEETARVSNFYIKTEDVSGKKLHTVEMFVEKSWISNWSDTADVQINYAWKNPDVPTYIIDEVTNKANVGWNTDWLAYHRYGGLWTDTNLNPTLLANLMITSTGIDRLDNQVPEDGSVTLDGDISEYNSGISVGDSSKVTLEVKGKVENGNLYMAFVINHKAWASYDGVWANNDNIEFNINGVSTALVFMEGTLMIPQGIDKAVAVTTGSGDELVTVVEMFIKGDLEAYKVCFATAGNGFGGWQPLHWDNDSIVVTTEGISNKQAITLENGIVLDGNLTDSIWTETVKNNVVTTTANGATLTAIGTKTADGVYLGVTVNHTVAPETSIAGGTDFWCYMNLEIRINGENTQYLVNCLNQTSINMAFSYCKTEQVEGVYVSVYEIFIPNEALLNDGVSASQTSIDFNIGGWFETGFIYPFGGDWANPTLNVSADGITVK